jgi:large subunit ribosomal protein L36
MKVGASIKSAKTRDKNCKVIRRGKKIVVINKKNPRMKKTQGKNRVGKLKRKKT